MARDRSEYKCPCCQLLNIDERAIEIDNKVIEKVGFKPDINSACRCAKHNSDPKVGGSSTSSHICEDPREKGEEAEKCEALDYSTPSSWRRAVIMIALVELKIKRIGWGSNFLHWDIDLKKPYPLFWVY